MTVIDKKSDKDIYITKEGAKAFKAMVDKSKYIKDVTIIPEFIMLAEQNLKNLRDVAALLQADFLLVIRSKSYTRYNFKVFKDNEAKASATMEAILLDVRTGVVPFTSIASASHKTRKGKTDFSDHDFKTRTTIGAEDVALKELSEDLVAFFN